MYQYYVIEVQKTNGEYGHNVFYLYDENADMARLKGEAKYHEILSYAAVSSVNEHSAIMFASDGTPIMHQCYRHEATPETPVENAE